MIQEFSEQKSQHLEKIDKNTRLESLNHNIFQLSSNYPVASPLAGSRDLTSGHSWPFLVESQRSPPQFI